MLDYFGSFTKPPEDVDKELIEILKKCINRIIKINNSGFKKSASILEYSITGWNMFAKKQLVDIIYIELKDRLSKNEKKLKSTYCLKNYLNNDILDKILNK